MVFNACIQKTVNTRLAIRNGFYQVVQTDSVIANTHPKQTGCIVIRFDTLFNPGDYSMVVIDTTDFVPLDLEMDPEVLPQDDHKKLLSVSLTPFAATKMKNFSAARVMKHVALVLDGKAITMHKIKEAITGNNIQITRCNDNACEYLYTKMKDR